MAAMFVNGSGRNEQWGPSIEASYQVSVHFGWGVLEAYLSVIQFIANCILPIFKLELSPFPQKNSFFYQAYNHKHDLPVAAMFVNGSGRNDQSL